ACYMYGLNPYTDIAGHYMLDPARRTDPQGLLRLLGKSFDNLLEDVAQELADSLIPDTPEVLLTAEDADKLIGFLSAGYFATEDAAARSEFNRLANELRRISGQPLE